MTYSTKINHDKIRGLSLTDMTTLREEIINLSNETVFKYGEGDFNNAISEHRDQLVDQLDTVLSVVDQCIAERLSHFFKIEIPDRSDALQYRPK